jgi:transposase, IS5 family
MVHRLIGQERLGFTAEAREASSLDRLLTLIDWADVTDVLGDIHVSARGEPAWPRLAMFKALLLSIWYDLSDVKLTEALDDRGSFLRFCGFSATEVTPERTAFVRYRATLNAHGLDRLLFEKVTAPAARPWQQPRRRC